jgi:hypothetical protein
MSNVHGSALSAAATFLAPWDLLGFPLSLLNLGLSNLTDGR